MTNSTVDNLSTTEKCPNLKPKVWMERGFKTYCCSKHAQEYCDYLNKTTRKISKNDQE